MSSSGCTSLLLAPTGGTLTTGLRGTSGRVARGGGATATDDEDAGGVFWYAGNVGLGTPDPG